MNLYTCLSFVGIATIFELCIVLVSGQPSCNEFHGQIKRVDSFKPANGLDSLAVAKAYQNSPGISYGYCSLFNNLYGCGSIRIAGNIFENGATITISGWNNVPNRGEHYGFTVRRRSSSNFHIYDFTPTGIRTINALNDGFWSSWRADYGEIPEHIRERFNFTIALVAANTSDGMTGVGFRFCKSPSASDSLNNFFERSGFVAFDTRQDGNHATIVNTVIGRGGDLFSRFVDVPLNDWYE